MPRATGARSAAQFSPPRSEKTASKGPPSTASRDRNEHSCTLTRSARPPAATFSRIRASMPGAMSVACTR